MTLGAGVDATVSNLGFLGTNVPLAIGRNVVRVRAQDAVGNVREQSIDVIRTAVGANRIVAVSGDGQSGAARSELPRSFDVQALDAEGAPIAGHPIQVDVLRGSGAIRSSAQADRPDGVTPARNLTLVTNEDGLARVWLTLGHDTRPASDAVRFRGDAMAEDVVFTATALTGPAVSLGLYGTAGTQFVATNSTPVEALMAQAIDAHGNPVSEALVTFRVGQGDAKFDARSAPQGILRDNGQAIDIRTDRLGVATVRPSTGMTAGAIRIDATLADLPTASATFQLASLARKSGPTSLGGVVMDHDGTPIAGVRLSIDRTPLSLLTGADGTFQFPEQVPPGKIDLFVDGRLVQFLRDGIAHEYPALHFEMPIVQGQQNQLPHPIYLPAVSIGRATVVGGNQDVDVTMPGFEGFSMRVRANSVTFPDGTRQGPIVVNAVNADRLPMVPLGTAGQFAGIGWTIQPTNTRFDPPIEVRIPNTEGLAPGRTLPIFQWDHDLAVFVPMGHGTVNEDGTQIVSDPGSGISKAGWGGGGPPPPPPNDGDNQCPVRCPSGIDGRATAAAITISANGNTTDQFLPQPAAGGTTSVAFTSSVTGTCPTQTITWTMGDGTTLTGASVTHNYSGPGDFNVNATLTCGACCAGASDTIRVAVIEVKYARSTACDGFDGKPSPPWLLVATGRTNTADATIDPSTAATDVDFKSLNTGFATVSPATASASPQVVTVTGVAKGDTEIESKNGTSSTFGSFKVAVKDRITKRVTIHAITEENDDVQTIPVGRGIPNQLCLRGGTNLTVDGTVTGDDVLVPGVPGPPPTAATVHTGPDGICNSTGSGDDVQVLPVGNGQPSGSCVGVGANGFRDTVVLALLGDDVASGSSTGVDSGPNGKCETAANTTNLVPTQVPNAATLQNHLNNDYWGKQTNVHFTVSARSQNVNFDLDRNGKLADPYLVSATWVEVDALRAAAQDTSADYNVYFVRNYEYPVALAERPRGESWIGDSKTASVYVITSHELGHLLGNLPDTLTDNRDLMNKWIDGLSGCRIPQTEWNQANP
ncbi:hypothetical protein C7S18_00175 [Ahniella affigens]|uniref:PKD domain-containing protein n=2 Tax=Ahniella affigens TaxID=2021234 RepID=A0A2P1PYM5_9GAMM|nr:hypothetical protein C7S18_00175 [Ahniella affigens]